MWTYVWVGDYQNHLFIFIFGYSLHLQIIKTVDCKHSKCDWYFVSESEGISENLNKNF